MIDTIYLDLDGVITDFTAGWQKVFDVNIPYEECNAWTACLDLCNVTMNDFWNRIEATPRFWEDLPFTEEAKHFLELFDPFNVILLSTPSHHGAGGKQNWIRENLPWYFYEGRYFLGCKKEALAGPTKLLVDDHDKNVDAFKEAGGYGILVPRYWNRLWHLCRDRFTFSYVSDQIKLMEYVGVLKRSGK